MHPQPPPRRRNAIVYNPALAYDSMTPTMLSFLRLLKHRYDTVLASVDGHREWRDHWQSLIFAEAVLEKNDLIRTAPDHPDQIAILGPTQAGKSSVINWLLGHDLAGVSPLAGFTVHPQGFAVDIEPGTLDWLDNYFRDYHRHAPEHLPHGRYDAYALTAADTDSHASPLRHTVLWDTPDFDSVDAEDYRPAVLRVAALADVAVLVLSKDKYADLSVWELMALLEPLAQPTLICLNKVDPAAYPALAESLRDKWRSTRRDAPPPIIPLPYLESARGNGLAELVREREDALAALAQARRAIHRKQHTAQARQLVAVHWSDWVAPVEAEHKLLGEWQSLLDTAIKESLSLYERDYLNHPHHYETFQRALAELLTLLEIPGLGGALVAARRAVTWPWRQIAKLGHIGRRQPPPDSTETAILNQALQHLFIRIGEALLTRHDDDPSSQAWWRQLAALFRDDKPQLSHRFEHAAHGYLRAFQPEIDQTAHRLYDHLREHPAMLNSLRATRVTTDAAALAVALHTGGIGVQDFIIAPAILSLTSLMTEGALGRYMDKAAAELKRKQLAAVEQLFRTTLQAQLIRLPSRIETGARFDIAPELLAAAARLDI